MREKRLTDAVRCSLENFGECDYHDKESGEGHVRVIPLYALSLLRQY